MRVIDGFTHDGKDWRPDELYGGRASFADVSTASHTAGGMVVVVKRATGESGGDFSDQALGFVSVNGSNATQPPWQVVMASGRGGVVDLQRAERVQVAEVEFDHGGKSVGLVPAGAGISAVPVSTPPRARTTTTAVQSIATTLATEPSTAASTTTVVPTTESSVAITKAASSEETTSPFSLPPDTEGMMIGKVVAGGGF